MKEISVKKAVRLIEARKDTNALLNLPYKMKIKDRHKKTKKIDSVSLKFLLNAITLTNLNHPETEDQPKNVTIDSIDSCYIFGSAVHPRYETVIKRYLFGLYTKEVKKRVEPNDIDILCFVNTSYDMKHIKSMTSWKMSIQGSYGTYEQPVFGNFDVSYYPKSLVLKGYRENDNFIKSIKDHGVCIMGENILNCKRYASWNHDTIKDIITCTLPRDDNFFKEKEEKKEDQELNNRFEIIDL